MKNLMILAMALFGSVALAQNIDTYEVQVDGLGCPFCAYGLEKKFNEFEDIDDVAIDIETGDFSFSYPSDSPLSIEQIIVQVEAAGYTPNDIKITRASGTVETNTQDANIVTSEALVTETVEVWGMCGMCQARIEKATLGIAGVNEANWDVDSKMLTVSFDPEVVTMDQIQQEVAGVGHDTELHAATDAAYEGLHACCKYDRKEQ